MDYSKCGCVHVEFFFPLFSSGTASMSAVALFYGPINPRLVQTTHLHIAFLRNAKLEKLVFGLSANDTGVVKKVGEIKVITKLSWLLVRCSIFLMIIVIYLLPDNYCTSVLEVHCFI